MVRRRPELVKIIARLGMGLPVPPEGVAKRLTDREWSKSLPILATSMTSDYCFLSYLHGHYFGDFMNFVRLLLGGLATGVGLRAGSDLYDRLSGKKAKDRTDDATSEFNPFRERGSQSAGASQPGEVDAEV